MIAGDGSGLVSKRTDPELLKAGTEPSVQWCNALEMIMDSKGLLHIESEFARHFASNPHAGEVVKGHKAVLAELGLCPYDGQPMRNPSMLDGCWSKAKRGAHIKTRLAFMRVLQTAALPICLFK